MITEEQVDRIIEKLVNRVEEANAVFLQGIGSSIKQIRNVTPSDAHKLEQILKYGGKYDEIVREIAKHTDLNVKDVDAIFSSYAKKDQMFYKRFYEYRNKPFVPFENNIALKTQTDALANMVRNEMYQFTRPNVLGYTVTDLDGNAQFMGLKETYNSVIDQAFLNVGQGKETFDTAMLGIMKELGGSGLKTLEFESGRSMRLDSAIRMHMKARLRELHNENQRIIGEEIEADGVEISVHANPADDHAQAQGHQFTNEQFQLLQETGTAEDVNGELIDMHRITKKGVSPSHRPISEYNCYHYVFAVVLGVNKPEYDEEELQEINDTNEMGFEFEGEHYTNYEGTQMQRALERSIREQKDTQILAKSGGNKKLLYNSQDKIRVLTSKYRKLSQASSLPMLAERLKVSGYKRVAKKK